MDYHYTEYPLQHPLADAVAVCWSFSYLPQAQGSTAPAAFPYRVLPDGCADLIVRYAHPVQPELVANTTLLICGVLPHFKLVELAPHTTLWGMQFRPGWMEPVLVVNPLALSTRLARAELYTPRLAELARLLRSATTPHEVETIFRDGVTRLACDAWNNHVGAAQAAHLLEPVQLLEHHRGQMPLHTLARTIGTSERTLHRHLSRAVGVSPKLFARILRFQHAVARLRSSTSAPSGNVALVALESGYCDQAHMAREFRALSGCTPVTFLCSTSADD